MHNNFTLTMALLRNVNLRHSEEWNDEESRREEILRSACLPSIRNDRQAQNDGKMLFRNSPTMDCVRNPKSIYHRTKSVILIPFLFFLIGCVHLIANYDPITYKSLTDLKAESMLFLEQVSVDKPFDEYASKFEDLRLKMEKVYQYEKGKKLNNDTIAQVSEIRGMINGMITLYKNQNHLSPGYLKEKKEQLENAFDLAISTENIKNK